MDPQSLKAAGWKAIEVGGFTGEAGPFWVRDKGSECLLGLIVEERHTNSNLGTLHGGVLMTFADVAFGYGAVKSIGTQLCATAQLQYQFVSLARIGEFVTCRPELVRRTSQLVFMRGLFCVGDKTIGSADGIWKVLEPRTDA